MNASSTPESRVPCYITSSIPYVNAPPHLGFALEMVQADVLARYYRLCGNEVRFQTGTDENSLKNVQAAEQLGIDTQTLVARNARAFYALRSVLNLSFDDFIRTSADARHRDGVIKLWNACLDKGDIYESSYQGLYCVGCEHFYTESELEGGCCPEHPGKALEEVSERNYFFRLSRYRDELLARIGSHQLCIEPEKRRNEVLRWIQDDLVDISVSRSQTRARGWGIPVPQDHSQVIYVWFDALGNYITALDYAQVGAPFKRFWIENPNRVHVIGKGISRFHAVYWPAILLSAGLPLPTRILVHGYITIDGQKISKSTGNVVDPIGLADVFGADALRYYLLRHIRSTGDGDFSRERFAKTYDAELANQLGNLLSRTVRLIERFCEGRIPAPAEHCVQDAALIKAQESLAERVGGSIGSFELDEALATIWRVIQQSNRYCSDVQPWKLARDWESTSTARARDADRRLRTSLFLLAKSLAVVADCCKPFLPQTSQTLLSQLGDEQHSRPWRAGADDYEKLIGRSVYPDGVLFPKQVSCTVP